MHANNNLQRENEKKTIYCVELKFKILKTMRLQVDDLFTEPLRIGSNTLHTQPAYAHSLCQVNANLLQTEQTRFFWEFKKIAICCQIGQHVESYTPCRYVNVMKSLDIVPVTLRTILMTFMAKPCDKLVHNLMKTLFQWNIDTLSSTSIHRCLDNCVSCWIGGRVGFIARFCCNTKLEFDSETNATRIVQQHGDCAFKTWAI